MTSGRTAPRIQILQVPGCPNASRARETVRLALRRTGIEAEVDELVGEYSSPTVLVGSRDVTGRPTGSAAAGCRLDLPTLEQVVAALRRIDRDEQGGSQWDAPES